MLLDAQPVVVSVDVDEAMVSRFAGEPAIMPVLYARAVLNAPSSVAADAVQAAETSHLAVPLVAGVNQ